MSKGFIFALLVVALLSSLVLNLFTGGTSLPASIVVESLLHPTTPGVAHTLVWELRLPRLFMAMVVGAGLASCGVILQAILRNPLAEPFTLGVSGGGALGATIAIVLGLAGFPMILLCFAGCLVSMVLVLGVASIKDFSNTMLILSGVIISFLFSSIVMFIFAVATSRDVHASVLWMMGSLGAYHHDYITTALLLIVLLTGVLMPFARDLNILTLGDEKTLYLGLDVKKAKILFFVLASLITGCCVAVSGIISFVGLIIPHIMRRIVGPDHRGLLPASMLAGAILLLLSDTLAQLVIRPLELPIGVITGIIGGLFFLGFLLKSRTAEGM